MQGATINTLYSGYFTEHNGDDEPHDRNSRLASHSVNKIQVTCDGRRIFDQFVERVPQMSPSLGVRCVASSYYKVSTIVQPNSPPTTIHSFTDIYRYLLNKTRVYFLHYMQATRTAINSQCR